MLDEKLLLLNEEWMSLQAGLISGSEVMLCVPEGGVRAKLLELAESGELKVTAVTTANEAAEGLEQQQHDLLVVAENPPDMSAMDLVRFTRGLPVTPAVIVLARSPSPRKVLDAIQLGVTDYLLEPEQRPEEVLERTLKRLEKVGRRKLQSRMIADLRKLHQATPPEERGLLVVNLKRQLEAFRLSLGPMNRVLIVDPDPMVRRSLGSALGGIGLMPSDALGGNSAVELLRQEGTDLVIVSGTLPDMQIPEIVSSINEVTEGVPLVLLAHVGELDAAMTALRMGFEDCIRKPLASPDHVAHRVLRVLKDRRRELLAENLIKRLYRLMRTASQVLDPEATAKVEQVFDEMIPGATDVESGPAAQAADADKPLSVAQRLAAEYEEEPPPVPPPTLPADARRGPSERPVRLTSGEVQIIAEDGIPDVSVADDLPDTLIIEYIDELLLPSESKRDLPDSSLSNLGAGQRLTPRVERSTFVRYGPTGTERASLGYAHDLSLGGMFILSDGPPPVGTDLQIELQLPDEDKVQRVRVQGRVMWHTNPERRPPQGDGFGVMFTVIDRKASAAIRRLVTS